MGKRRTFECQTVLQAILQAVSLAVILMAASACSQKSTLSGVLMSSSSNGASSGGSSGGGGTTGPTNNPPPLPPPHTPPVLPSTIKTVLSVPPAISSTGHQDDLLIYSGYLDVTLYGADPTGKKDSTSALQQAINDAMKYSLMTYVPCPPQTPCTYVVSKTLLGVQGLGNPACTTSINTGTFYPYGSAQAPGITGPSSGPRPTIQLADGSSGFNDPTHPQPLLHFINNGLRPDGTLGPEYVQFPINGKSGASDCFFYGVIRDINFSLGSGNAGASAIQFYTAQYSYMENVFVKATGAYAGIQGIPGTGVWTNLEVDGGKYGVMFDEGGGAMAIAGLTLENQNTAGFYAAGDLGATTVSGFRIQESSATGVYGGWGWGPQTSSLNLVDGSIIVQGNQPAIANSNGASLFLNNVYLQAPSALIQNSGQTSVSASGALDWVKEYGHADPGTEGASSGQPQKAVNVVDGNQSQNDFVSVQNRVATMPSDFVQRHIPGPLPWIGDPGVVYVTAFGADPTGKTDSTAAIQKAVNSGLEVFLPRGDYIISGTISLQPHTRLFGVPGGRSRIFAPYWNPTVNNGGNPFQPMISTADSATGTVYVGDLVLDLDSYPSGHVDPIYGVNATYINAINWQTGRSSVLNQVYPDLEWTGGPDYATQARKVVHVMNHGGGRFYGMDEAYLNVGQARQSNPQFRLLFVDSTQAPLTLYGPNPEHNNSTYYEVTNSSNFRILGMKTENSGILMSINNSDNVLIAGVNGDYALGSGPEFTLNNSTNAAISCIGYYAYGVGNASHTYISNGSLTYTGADAYGLFQVGNFNPYCGTSGFTSCSGRQQAFPYCGDGYCDGGETTANCPADCK